MSLKNELNILDAELCRFACENSYERVPVLFLELKGKQSIKPIINNLYSFLNKEYTQCSFTTCHESLSPITDSNSENATKEYVIQTKPEVLKIQINSSSKTENAIIWFHNPGVNGNTELIDREKIINQYITYLNKS